MSETWKIAVVDDHTMIRKSLSMLINAFPNCQVILEAGNGLELKEKIEGGVVPDIVLLDIAMPKMDGYETAIWLKEAHPAIKVLVLSTLDSEFHVIRMILKGAKGYVLKDDDPSELMQAFDSLMANECFYNDQVTRKVMKNIHHLMDEKSLLSVFANITDREMHFLKLACSEKSYREIANEMFVSERTVEGYRVALCEKLSIGNRIGLVLFAMKHQLVSI